MPNRFLIVTAASLVAACAAPDEAYPTLLPRPIENTSFAEPDRPAPEAVADPALEVKIDEQARTLSAAGTVFDRAAAQAERLGRAARGAAAGTEPWIAAQVALSDLDALRGGTSGALADIERLAIDRAGEGLPAYPALQSLLDRAEGQNRTEIARIGSIENGVRPAE